MVKRSTGRRRRVPRLLLRLLVAYIAFEVVASMTRSWKTALAIFAGTGALYLTIERGAWRKAIREPGHGDDPFWRYAVRPGAVQTPVPGTPASTSLFSFVSCAVATGFDWMSFAAQRFNKWITFTGFVAALTLVNFLLPTVFSGRGGLVVMAVTVLVVAFAEGAYELWRDAADTTPDRPEPPATTRSR